MRSFLGGTFLFALVLLGLPLNSLAEEQLSYSELKSFSRLLQTVLNADISPKFDFVATAELQHALVQRYQRFRKDFPEATWQVEPAVPLADGRQTFLLRVSGDTESRGLRYRLQATERIAIRFEDGRMVDQELVAHESLLLSGERPLAVTLAVPDVVLTGSRYDIDLIVDEPLDQALVAAGLIDLTQQQVQDQLLPNMPLAPMGGGGLFKSVQAPQAPGSQTWALMLVHPDGLVIATKRVKVVSSL